MADLVEKYFNGDLTEADQQALSQELLSSDESALKFERMAKEAYLGFGLPDPVPHWPDGPKGLGGYGFKPWASFLIVGLGALTAAYLWRPHWLPWISNSSMGRFLASEFNSSSDEPGQKAQDRGLPHPAPKTTHLGKTQNQGSDPVANEGKESEVAQPKPHTVKPPVASSAPGVPAEHPFVHSAAPSLAVNHASTTPINLDQNPTQSYPGLSVEVSQAKPGPLSVRVLGMAGNVIAVLYQGNLGPGTWAFVWDGQLSNGQPAPAGAYRIEVRSGVFTQYKKIQIQ